MHLAAQQRINRLLHSLADNIPQRAFKTGEHAHQRYIGALRIAAAIDIAPKRFNLERVSPQHMMLEHILYHGSERMRAEAGRIHFPNAGDAGVGGEFYENKVAPTMIRRRVADNKGFQLCDLHAQSPPIRLIRPRRSLQHKSQRAETGRANFCAKAEFLDRLNSGSFKTCSTAA